MKRLIALHEASHIVIALTLAPLAAARLTRHGDYYEVVYTENSLVTDVECGMIILAGKAVEHLHLASKPGYLHNFDAMIEESYDGKAFVELGFDAGQSHRIWQDTIDVVREHYKQIAKLASRLQKLYN